jgi:hypothetical protein
LVRYVVLGGTKRHNTAGAVPNVEYGLAVSVPPEIFEVTPVPASNHVVVKVNVVDPALTAACTRTKSPVYGLTVLFN